MDASIPANQYQSNVFDEILAGINGAVHAYGDAHDDHVNQAMAHPVPRSNNAAVLVLLAVLGLVFFALD